MEETLLIKLYITDGLSQRGVAEHLGISQTTVRYYLEKYKIKKNKPRPVTESGSKRCPKCEVTKPLTDFYKQIRPSGNVCNGSWCKACVKGQTVVRQRHYKQQAIDLKGGGCRACGFKAYAGALDFHHIDPSTKDMQAGRFSRKPTSYKLSKELNKCVLVCANCHRMIHAGVIECPPIKYLIPVPPKDAPKHKPDKLTDGRCGKAPPARCPDCDVAVCSRATRCRSCAAVVREGGGKINWPSNDELLSDVKERNYTQVAKQLGVSDNAIRKRLRRAGLL